MKNIHILPTNKPSRFQKTKHDNFFLASKIELYTDCIAQHIYITSDEEIKEGEYGIDIRDSKVFKCERTLSNHYEFGVLQFQKSYCKKIILTTDKNLDGVQAIDDEFLEWYVQNPSCEKVKVVKENLHIGEVIDESYPKGFLDYKIIIPSIGIISLNKQD
jgi:hypothetical protein